MAHCPPRRMTDAAQSVRPPDVPRVAFYRYFRCPRCGTEWQLPQTTEHNTRPCDCESRWRRKVAALAVALAAALAVTAIRLL